MKTTFIRKASSYRELSPQEVFEIENVVTLELHEFNDFANNLLRDYDFIKDNRERMYQDEDGVMHCILVTAEEVTHGILVQAEGHSYARYSAYIDKSRLDIRW